jgi:hypothetical protein
MSLKNTNLLKNKSSGQWLAAWARKRMATLNINMSSSFLKYYGVYFGNENYSAYKATL